MSDHQDNIADSNEDVNAFLSGLTVNGNVTESTLDPIDEYMQKFDQYDAENKKIANTIACFRMQPDDQARLYSAMDCIKYLQKQNERAYEIMIEMNNIFGGSK